MVAPLLCIPALRASAATKTTQISVSATVLAPTCMATVLMVKRQARFASACGAGMAAASERPETADASVVTITQSMASDGTKTITLTY